MLQFDAKHGVYSPKEIITEQLVPFLESQGISRNSMLFGENSSPLYIDDEGKESINIDLLFEEEDYQTGQNLPRLLAVVKSPGRELRSYEKQAVAMGILKRTPFVMVTDGLTAVLLKTPITPIQKNDIPLTYVEEFPPIQELCSVSLGAKPAESLKALAQRELRLIHNSDALIAKLEECDEIIRVKIMDTRKRFVLLSKILFAKLMDEKAVIDGTYTNPRFSLVTFDKYEREHKLLLEEMLKEFALEYGQDLFENLKVDLPADKQKAIITRLQGITFMAPENDIKGMAYEHFLKSTMRQKDGQYFTPRKVINFILDMLQPKLGDKVLDPAAGSGGFLIAYFLHQRREIERRYFSNDITEQEMRDMLWSLSNKLIHGVELDDDLARECMMNMIVHGDGHSRIFQGDGLSDIIHEGRTVIGADLFDIIITNPPFGEPKIKKNDERMKRYDLGKTIKWDGDEMVFVKAKGQPKLRNQQEPQHLFVERVIKCLKPGGKAAIVLPDGIFNNSSDEYARRYIMKKCIILAVVSMPDLTFTKSGTGVRTNVMFIQKKLDESVKQEQDIFMAICDNIGYNSKGEEIEENDLQLILQKYLEQENINA